MDSGHEHVSIAIGEIHMTTPSKRPEIAAVTDPSPETAEILSKGLAHDGEPFNAAAVLAHHPLLLKRFTVFAGLFLSHSVLPDRDRELLTLRSTYQAKVSYYFGHHREAGIEAGLTQDEIHALAERSPGRWSERDRLLISVADQLVSDTNVDDVTWRALCELYDEPQLIEAVMLIGFYRMVGGFVNTVGVRREAGVPGWPD